MLAVSAVLVASVTFLLIEGSLVFYLLPAAPAWLRRSKDLQVTISCTLINGVILALYMLGQYLVDLGSKPVRPFDIVLAAGLAVASVAAWRRLNAFHRRVRKDMAAKEENAPAVEQTWRRAA